MDVCEHIYVLDFGTTDLRRVAPGGSAAATGSAPPTSGSGGLMFELRDVSSGYGATDVLHDVDVRVPPASVVALLGSNGAGKTTLLRTASRLIPIGRGPSRSTGRTSRAGARPARRRRRVPRPRGPWDLPAPHGAREPAAAGRPGGRAVPRPGHRGVPAAGRSARPGGRDAQRGRAADAGHRAAPSARPECPAARRGVDGAGPDIVDEIFESLAAPGRAKAWRCCSWSSTSPRRSSSPTSCSSSTGRVAFAGEAERARRGRRVRPLPRGEAAVG